MIKHSHLSFSTAAPCVQARLASPIHPQGTLDTLTHKSWAKSFFQPQIYNTSVQPTCTPPKNFLIFIRLKRKSTGKFETKQQEQTSSIPVDSNNSKGESFTNFSPKNRENVKNHAHFCTDYVKFHQKITRKM